MKGLTLRDHEVRRLLDTGSVVVVREVKLPRAREGWATHSLRPCLYGDGWSWHDEHGNCHNCDWVARSPIGAPCERRWVREAFAPSYFDDGRSGYRADWTALAADVASGPKWTSSAQMPRWASRAVVEVASVRVARLRDLSDADVEAAVGFEGYQFTAYRGFTVARSAREFLAEEVVKATGSIDGNHWVWVAVVSRAEVA